MPQPLIIYSAKDITKILDAFAKRFPGKLLYRHSYHDGNSSFWEYVKSVKRDRFYKVPSIYLENGLVIPLSQGFKELYVRDYYREPCRVLEAKGLISEGDPLQYQLYINLPQVRLNQVSVVLIPNIPDKGVKPHHMILDDELLQAAMITHVGDPIHHFVKGIRYIANHYIWPDGEVMDRSNHTISGNVTTLFIP